MQRAHATVGRTWGRWRVVRRLVDEALVLGGVHNRPERLSTDDWADVTSALQRAAGGHLLGPVLRNARRALVALADFRVARTALILLNGAAGTTTEATASPRDTVVLRRPVASEQ
jgi:hypothetical protein